MSSAALYLDDAEDALDRVRLVGDLIVGAFWSSTKDKEREAERARRQDLVAAWLADDRASVPAELRELQAEVRATIPVFHWSKFSDGEFANRST